MVGFLHVKSMEKIPLSSGHKFSYISRLYSFSDGNVTALCAFRVIWAVETIDWPPIRTEHNTSEVIGTRYQCLCPVIHFPPGMVERRESIIIAYRISDCFSYMVEIGKRTIALHLIGSIKVSHKGFYVIYFFCQVRRVILCMSEVSQYKVSLRTWKDLRVSMRKRYSGPSKDVVKATLQILDSLRRRTFSFIGWC